VSVEGLDALLAAEGWPHASATAVEAGDPGRYHALFGRDSTITALQVLPERPDVARATLRALAERQGRRDDPATGEEPGKVLHELWPGGLPGHAPAGWPNPYYGSADGTSWFLHLAAELGEPVVDHGVILAAGAWLHRALERGGGLVRWSPPPEGAAGLVQQGWRDVTDAATARSAGSGIAHPDGTLPRPPVADADTQAAALAGLRALHRLTGDPAHARAHAALRERVTAAFGDGETMALDAGDRPVPGAGSQLGWLLWAGVRTDAIAGRLTRPDVLTPYGLRTLAASHGAFRPDAYHRGSVWPFDSWLGWAGLRAAGRDEAAERVRTGVLAALDRLGRAPELYAVTGAGEPEPIPAANRVQAWTVGARWALEQGWDGGAAPPEP